MTEELARKQLRKMLRSFTPGGVLHLLADIYREAAAKNRDAERSKRVEETLYVVGLGIDAATPR
jgi:hypothetical protein